MATMNMNVSHDLSEAEAKERIKKLLGETKKQYGGLVTDLKESWKGNRGTISFKARGYGLAGTIIVGKKKVSLQGELPWTFSFMKGKIETMITARAEELLQS